MTTLANANLPSSDEEDEDFVPDEYKDSEPQAKRRPKRVRGAGATDEAEETEEAEEEALVGKQSLKPKLTERTMAEKRAKTEKLWEQLNQGMASNRKPINLSAIRKPASGKATDEKDKVHDTKTGQESGRAAGKLRDIKALAANALMAAKAATSATAAGQYGTVTINETRRFAGQSITMERQVNADSKEAAKAMESAKKKAGLDAVLESLAQAKKVTVLDKSQSDWKKFKKTDDALEAELEAHKRSGATYLERQEFLGKTELAEYERERDQRLASDVRSRGRL
jgi:hypothetical protein